MPILRTKDIANMSPADRSKRLSDLRAELTRIKTMVKAGGAVENPTRIRELRKAIAKILTVENEQKLGIREAPAQPEKQEKTSKKPKAKKETKEKASQ
ncbi:MAG: 50S ribosomal protein L29 [Candidatus Bathyarchaeota archaeon]|nr:50S ribosomal protein L29 [Candidatus Bathyarchaeota archaeon]